MSDPSPAMARYWDALSPAYQSQTRISTVNFHYGPLLPGDDELGIIPTLVPGMSALEIGGGAGQNSLCLTRRGIQCTVTDLSERQLEHGRKLAAEAGLDVKFQRLDMDELEPSKDWKFDFIHSTYALPFSRDPERVIRRVYDLLNAGGWFLLTVGHPLYSGEWLDVDEDEGVFLTSYFDPPADERDLDESGKEQIQARSWPISTVTGWLRSAGLRLERFEEPRPAPIDELGQSGPDAIPYFSEDWMDLYPALREIPVVAVFLARKPA